MPKEQIYFRDVDKNPYWDKQADADARKDLARKIRAHKLAMIAYGMSLYECATGERPVIKPPRRKHVAALVVDAASILDTL